MAWFFVSDSFSVDTQTLGMLAQLVEQRTFNPFVVGSTPARPTKKIIGFVGS